jgi:hypothetical protein
MPVRVPALNHELQMKMCEYHARYMPVKDILFKFKEDHGVTITETAARWYLMSRKWAPIIQDMREKWVVGVLEIPISQKRVRMERLENLYQKALAARQISTAKEILKAAKEEIEGTKSGDINIQMNKIEMISDEEIKNRMRKIKEEMAAIPIERIEATMVEKQEVFNGVRN